MDHVPLPKSSRLWRGKVDLLKPFRSASSHGSEHVTPLYDPAVHHQNEDEPDLRSLNASLSALIEVFPDVEPEFFREMLLSISEESRVEIITEHILKKDARWMQSRSRTPRSPNISRESSEVLAKEDAFRSESYKQAVKQVCYQEFRNLSHSSVKAVLAEQNYSYTLSRPVLQHLTTKSWRFTISNLWSRRSPLGLQAEHPYVVRPSTDDIRGSSAPALRRTGNAHLDQELWQLLVNPEIRTRRHEQLAKDHAFAKSLAEAEAEEALALFECECCFSSVPFEEIVACDNEAHQLCQDCVRRTVDEALYGQGWSRTVDLERSTVRCFAPSAHDGCTGCLPPWNVQLALEGIGGRETDAWSEFQTRVMGDALLKSRIQLQRCPFCVYAEADELPSLVLRDWKSFWGHVATCSSGSIQFLLVCLLTASLLCTVPMATLTLTIWAALRLFAPAAAVLRSSWSRVYKQRQGIKFTCLNPACGKTSCTRCAALWRDPHTCFETERTSLRTAIESSATAAIKRTCPRCMLSFVKSSGCNKLVCNCGYTMCYICRQEITSKEGYAHFCQHFRPSGGRCSECERCDLYGDEDEEAAIRQAVDTAEKAWRDEEGGKSDTRVAELMVEALVGKGRVVKWWEGWLDGIVDAFAA